MKAALYVRVSTEDQIDGFSLSAQTSMLSEYCKKENVEIYKIYADEGISGQKENRPQFQQMVRDAEASLFHIILVHKYDRFARKVELSQRIKNQLSKHNVNVVSITEPIEDSPMGFFVSGLHELMAEYYIKNLAAEVKKGMRERVKQGLSNGSVPYGYQIKDGKMSVNNEQAIVVKKIFEMYNEGYGTPRITNWLIENGIHSAILGAKWNHFSVLYILRNVKYIGYIKHAGEIYQGVHEPIIDKSTFELAQKFLVDRNVKKERKPRGINETKFMLLGLLKCGICGCKMGIQSSWESYRRKENGEKYFYYLCSGHRRKETAYRCNHNKYYPTQQLEDIVLLEMERLIEDHEFINKTNDINTSYLLKSQIERLEREKERAKSAYLSEAFTVEEYKEIKNECDNKIMAIKEELSKTNTVSSIEIQNVLKAIKSEPSPAKRRLMLSKYIEVIRVFPDRIQIVF